ncbi:hypothetical protein [Schaalia sp. lx-100]|uniref:hypothetical protein n=1 Tax=Schaalia sp. lx-100 TaxID=2899081 RepID=UPI001E4885F0|nr:hypothetical protein [Schaalia sp. lx-100]MCD4557638.1 hypothetical protein [Schaalia sp. lx-100]
MSTQVQLTQKFRYLVENTGMTHAAIAAAMGITRQFFSAVWLGKEQPTARFAVGALQAGLGHSFDDVMILVRDNTEESDSPR